MNTPVIGALLAHDKVDRYRSFGAFGKPAYQNHVQMRAMLRTQRGPKVANYFARPTYDPDSGELRWTSEVPGEARAWHEMPPEEQSRRAVDKLLIHGELLGLIKDLRATGGAEPGGAAAFADLLEQAMKVPADDRFTFFVGDQPMIAFWGFADANGASVVASAPPPQLAAGPQPPDATAPAATAPATVPTATVARRRPWWWWLVGLLLGLLLLALLLWLGPRACTPQAEVDARRAAPASAPPDGAASAPRDERRDAEPAASAPVAGGGAESAVPGSAMAIDPAASQPAAESPAASVPPRDEAADKPDPAASAPIDNLLPKTPDEPAKPQKDDAPVKPPPKKKDLELPSKPDDRKQMKFLEGDWKAGEGLVDTRTQKPIDLGINFGKDGRGELTMRQPDGTTCKGAVQGRVDGGKLTIQGDQKVPCSNGTNYGAPKIECAKESGGQTQCYGVNADGSRYYMGMRRQ